MMRRSRRVILISSAAVCGLLLLTAASAFYTLQTDWFKEKIRQKIVAVIENASGGRVELGRFDYDWHTLTAGFGNLAIHGTELRSGPPLFRAKSVRVGLTIISLLKRQMDIRSLTVEGPEICLLLRPDGTSNIPAPKLRRSGGIVQELLSLKVRHFALNQGTIQAEARRIPLTAHGEDLGVALSYDFARTRYDVTLSSHPLRIHSAKFPAISADLDARAAIEKHRIVWQQVVLKSGASNVNVSGTLAHFTRPEAAFNISAQVVSTDFALIMKLPELRGGLLALKATAHYDPFTKFMFNGKVTGHDLTYASRSFTLKHAEFESDLRGTPEELRFLHASFSALGSRVVGAATLKQFHQLQLDGRITAVSIRDVGRLSAAKPLPWSAVASGPIHIEGTLDRNSADFVVRSDLQLTPALGGIPVSGNAALTYKERGNVLELARSRLDFPNTHLSVSGTAGTALQIALDSTNLDDIEPVLRLTKFGGRAAALPVTLVKGSLHFDGTALGPLMDPRVRGNLALAHFRAHGQMFDQFRSAIDLSADDLDFTSLAVDQGMLHATGNGHLGLANWSIRDDFPFRVQGQFKGADVRAICQYWTRLPIMRVPIDRGIASGSLEIAGSPNALHGTARLTIDNVQAYGEAVNQVEIATTLAGDTLQITRGRIHAAAALLSFSGTYKHVRASWREGQVRVRIDTNGFPLASLSTVRNYKPGLTGDVEVHAQAAAHVASNEIEPTDANGTVVLRNVAVHGVRYGDVAFSGATHGQILDAKFSGDLRETRLNGTAHVQLISGTPVKGELQLDRIDLPAVYALLHSGHANPLPIQGFLKGALTFEGTLQSPAELRSTIHIEQIQFGPSLSIETTGHAKPGQLIFRNLTPIVLDASNGVATIRSFQMVGQDTALRLTGSIPYIGERPMNLRADGSLDLRVFEIFDPGVQSSGESQIAASIQGTVNNPALTGTLEVKNASFFVKNVPNGLSGVNGTVKFEHDRATIQKLIGRSGGGDLSLTGFVSFARGGPLVYHLEASADHVRLRYAGGISVTANSGLRLTGTSKSSLLSGTVEVSRIAFNPNTDVGSLLARDTTPAPPPANQSDFLTGLQLDIRVESTPDLQLTTSLSEDVEAEIDLRVRGTPDRPLVVGNVSANQGDIKLFGTKYSINRGQVNFINPVKIEPVLDLDLQTQARGITVDINISGTLSKLNINYRSDPPLQPRDIVALLTVGRAPDVASNVSNVQTKNDVSALQSGANTVLGHAISPASNRLSKLFGITSIKIDPFVQGIITNTPQARLTVEQQMSRDITVTYVTNLSQTSEQVFRLEWALNRNYSVIALRDDNGEFGIDIQYKKRFK
ncbi:MAG: translocation/assembly module TamB domain-containing protein [Bryobacteraceae bacterium]